MNEDIQKLELRITELENQLKSASAVKVDPEEFKTFQKVSQQLGISGCINECQPSICVVCHVCFRCFHCIQCNTCFCNTCINECSCGPLFGSSGLGAGGTRFGSLG